MEFPELAQLVSHVGRGRSGVRAGRDVRAGRGVSPLNANENSDGPDRGLGRVRLITLGREPRPPFRCRLFEQ
jgi:hypothetical protein